MFFLETERLQLIPLPHDMLTLCQQDRAAMEAKIGLNTSAMCIDPVYIVELEDALANFWIPMTATYPDRYQWYTNWEIVLKKERLAIGGIGFIGYPDDNGQTETGFMLDKNFHGKGYAKEALISISNWAFTHDELKTIIAKTAEDNLPSRKLLESAGFMRIGQEADLLIYCKQCI
ncbi:GNAT family N-acetyltransferase [Chitinophaga pinensis]|uniref:GNAT family N-acetyltransferase n=1 Tax=Chitinophaga pinensis TaxID=79329 RepID=A0A5C6LV73_9BACT|nr:GNAT family N-acetyltransferase [Chitinophaga pinensis]TWW00842.1 GNAT family N-acetyltransferase [Chitinophaga pinensis]